MNELTEHENAQDNPEACGQVDSIVMQWKTINTAPIDTPILITNGKTVTTVVLKIINGVTYQYHFKFHDATYWMELPIPPQN